MTSVKLIDGKKKRNSWEYFPVFHLLDNWLKMNFPRHHRPVNETWKTDREIEIETGLLLLL